MDNDSKNIGIASYITPAGWLVALAIRWVCDVPTPFAIFHLRQGLGLNIFMILSWIIFNIYNLWLVMQIVNVCLIVCAIYGIVGASRGRLFYQIPFGKLFDRYFTFIK